MNDAKSPNKETLPLVVFLTSTPGGQECTRRVERLHWLPWMFRVETLHLPNTDVQNLAQLQLQDATVIIEITGQEGWEITPIRAAAQSMATRHGVRFVSTFDDDDPAWIVEMMMTHKGIAAAKKNRT